MAETAAVISRDEEEIRNSSDDEDRLPTHDAASASPHCSASPSLGSLIDGKGSSAVPEGLSVLSSRAVAQREALTGPEMLSGGQEQRTAPGLPEHPPAAVDVWFGSSSCPATAEKQPVDLASLHGPRPRCHGKWSSRVLQAPGRPAEACEAAQAGADRQPAGSGADSDAASCGLGRIIWMKTTTVLEALENKKQEEKEKFRLQLAMYRRLLLLRSIRSLHRQLERQQARLQECYGTVINTKKEVLKHTCSTLPSSSP